MRTDRTTQRTIVAALLPLALAAPARADEGGLVIFPDLFLGPSLSLGAVLGSHYVQLIALFVLMILPVNRLVLQPLLRVVDERGAKIEGARKRASEVSAQAEAVLGRYQSAVEQARKQAEELRRGELDGARGEHARVVHEARTGAEAEVTRARAGVANAVAAARTELRRDNENLAREVAARVLGRALS